MGEWRQRGRRNRIFNRGRKECLLSVCNSASVFTCRLNNTNLPPTHPPPSLCILSQCFLLYLSRATVLLPFHPFSTIALPYCRSFSFCLNSGPSNRPFAPSFSNIIFQEKGSTKPRLVDFLAAGTKWRSQRSTVLLT